ncbi:hypothetical protein MAPG_10247 [Magnaporthiopsis poae ATCC 64411]|uniref:Uncharacterized protein n=1 Tax=Magnaporthiopsis poae (strain ATCC 64411 / 73-15) TaxID=644358 RepID=A0A0C4EC33_MAGP6|nr:hypothetical protein MAPG_10247 [Magnaporthiopsis poae ATCC 64411]
MDRVVRTAADITLFTDKEEGGHTFLRIDEMQLVPLSAANQANDAVTFWRVEYKVAEPDAALVVADAGYEETTVADMRGIAVASERIASYCLGQPINEITAEERANALPHFKGLIDYTDEYVPGVVRGENKLSVGENIAQVIRENGDILQHVSKDAMLESFGLAKGNGWLASLAEQTSHRFPKMSLLEIGAGSPGSSTREILTRLGDAFLTYTYADVPGSVTPKAQRLFGGFVNRMIFKPYDMDKSPASQGFAGGAAMTPSYAFTQEVATTNDRLRKTGFGGIESATLDMMPWVGPGRVFVAQATGERGKAMRYRLEHLSSLPAARAPRLCLIGGGKTQEVRQMCDTLHEVLSSRYPETVRHESIEALSNGEAAPMVEGSTVVCLSELEQPLMEVITPEKLDALRLIYRHAKDVLFVTRGARLETPHSYMMLGVGRCMRFEHTQLNLQILDFDRITEDTVITVAEQLLRLETAGHWSSEGPLLYSVEPEVYVENDRQIIPRPHKDEVRNSRYNTTRRVVREEIEPATVRLVFEPREQGAPWEAQVPSPPDMPAPLPSGDEDVGRTRTLRMTHFIPSTITVAPGVRLMPFVGRAESESESGHKHKLYLGVAHSTESPAAVPVDRTFALHEGADRVAALASFAAALAHSGS